MLVLGGILGVAVVLSLKVYAKNRVGPLATAARIVVAVAIAAVTVAVVVALAASAAVLALIAVALVFMGLFGMVGNMVAGG